MSEPNIKILMSCHKGIVAPQSNIFLPVHVGAEQAKLPLKNTTPDNTGDNISERNFTFCELTAQYWAWKNLNADYYGLCHYRRYFCFDGKRHHANDHKQIEVKSLNQFTLKEYRLDDEGLIRSCVAGNDIITPPYWNVKGTPTEDGPKKTIKEHMMGYGLIDEEGFALLENIVEKNQPEFKQDLDSYLNGSQYLGYNCYIMKKDLFFQLCDFEFSILFDFDKQFDYENRTTTQKRVCGYLGEILYSVFINHLRRTSNYKIAQYPMVFFEDTKPLFSLEAENTATRDDNTLDIVWRYYDKLPEALAVGISSLIEQLDPQKTYRLHLLCRHDFDYNFTKQLLPAVPKNLAIEQTTWQNIDLDSLGLDLSEEELYDLYPLLLPWLGNAQHKILWVDGLCVFNNDPVEVALNANTPLTCNLSVLTERELNRPKNKAVLNTYRSQNSLAEPTLSPSVIVLDPAALRESFALQDILRQYQEIFAAFDTPQITKIKAKRFPQEYPASYLAAQSVLLQKLNASAFNFSDATQSINFEETQKWANEGTFKEWKDSTTANIINYRAENYPYLFPDPVFAPVFWNKARRSNSYELILLKMFKKRENRLIDLLLPKDSLGRKIARKLITIIRRS